MPRFDSTPVFDALAAQRRRPAAGRRDDGRVGGAGPRRAGLRPRHGRSCARGCGTTAARASNWSTSRRASCTATACSGRPSWCAGCGRWPATRACASAVRPRGDWGATPPTLTRGSHHLRYVLPALHAAPEHQRAADLPAGRHLVLAAPADQPAARPRRDAGRRHRRDGARLRGADRAVLAPLDAPPGRAAGVAGRGDPRRHHAQAVPVRGDRRHRRGDDHQHSRGAAQRPQLGLPLLLAARRLLRRARAQQPGRGRHHGGLPALALQRGARRRQTAMCSRCTASDSSARCRSR